MKLNFLLPWLMLFVSSCGDNDNEGPQQGTVTLACNPTSIEAEAVEIQYQLAVTCSSGEWTAFANDNCKEWITAQVTNASLDNGQVTVTVKANTTAEQRSGNVTIKSGQTRLTVPVTQKAPMQYQPNNFIPTQVEKPLP